MEHAVHGGRHQGGRHQGLAYRQDDDAFAALFEPVQAQIAPHAKGDKGQGGVGHEVHPRNDVLGNEVEQIRANGHPGQNIAGHVG